MSEAPAIRVRHLSHRYGAREVLRDVSFDVAHGEIFGFIGPNGAGKTTTIRVMATLLEPATGRVEIDGFDVSIDPDKVRRAIGYMPDHAGVYERITVREFLEFFADAYQVPENAAWQKTLGAGAADASGLGFFLGRLVRVNAELTYTAKQMERLRALVAGWFDGGHAALTVADFRGLTGASRKFGVPLLEHCDRVGWTVRVGDERRKG